MPAFKRPENLVSYRLASPLDALELSRHAEEALRTASTPEDQSNYRTQAVLAAIQRYLQDGDGSFDAGRYQQALESYRVAGRTILSILDPDVGGRPIPRSLPSNQRIADGLLQASAGLLSTLLPSQTPPGAVALRQPVHIPPDATGANAFSSLQPQETVSDEALAITDQALSAVQQAR